MYSKAKSCVKTNNTLSNFFSSSTGVRQGENLSPVLFSIFLNDLTQFMSTKFEGLAAMSMATFKGLSDDDVDVYLRIFLLLYADDTVLLAESQIELQRALDAMYDYCCLWDLHVNESKTKVVVFTKRKPINGINIYDFFYNNNKLETVNDFSYLGVQFNYNGNFSKTKARLVEQARRAMFSVINKSRKLGLPISLQLHLFDTMIAPILLYGSEVWGFENLNVIRQFQLKYCKLILGMKLSTPNCMVYGELGINPIVNQVKTRVLCYWANILNSKHDKICKLLYNTALSLHKDNTCTFPWISFVKKTLDELGLSEYFMNQNVGNINHFKATVKKRLQDQYQQDWNSTVDNSSKCLVYRMYKTEYCFEDYLDILPCNLGKALCKFRTMNHSLPIEKGRYFNIDRNERLCTLCDTNVIGDEFHYLFECDYFNADRKKYIPKYYYTHPSSFKLNSLMNCKNKSKLVKLALFCKLILSKFK